MKRLLLLLLAGLLLSPLSVLAAPVVLFDEGHGQQFKAAGERPLDLSGLAGLFTAAGCQVRTTTEPLAASTLAEVKALILSGPFLPLQPAELTAVLDYIAAGGKLAIMLHVAPPAGPLLHALQVDFSNGTLYEHEHLLDERAQDFKVVALTEHPLLAGLSDFAVYGAWALQPTAPSATALAHTSQHAWVDLNQDRKLAPGDAVQSFAVLVAGSHGQGQFVVFGDDAIFQNRFLVGTNQRLAGNLVRWLTGVAAP